MLRPTGGDGLRAALRSVLVVILLLLGSLLLRSTIVLSHVRPTGPPTHVTTGASGELGFSWWPVASSAAVLVVAVAWAMGRRRRRRRAQEQPDLAVQQPPVKLHPAIAFAMVVCALVAPWLLLLLPSLWHGGTTGAGTGVAHHTGHAPPAASPPRPSPGATGIPLWLFAVLAVALAVAVAGVLVIGRRRTGRPTEQAELATTAGHAEATALSRAQRATRGAHTARGKIISAYAALEESLAEQGVGRGATETPDELLARIVIDHPGVSDDATGLTDTFQYARFSTAPVTSQQVDDATHSMERLERALRELP